MVWCSHTKLIIQKVETKKPIKEIYRISITAVSFSKWVTLHVFHLKLPFLCFLYRKRKSVRKLLTTFHDCFEDYLRWSTLSVLGNVRMKAIHYIITTITVLIAIIIATSSLHSAYLHYSYKKVWRTQKKRNVWLLLCLLLMF